VDNIIIEAAISTNRRILLIIIDEVINRVTVIEFILGPNVGPFEAAVERIIDESTVVINFGAQRGASISSKSYSSTNGYTSKKCIYFEHFVYLPF
jgi:hypothetical protein